MVSFASARDTDFDGIHPKILNLIERSAYEAKCAQLEIALKALKVIVEDYESEEVYGYAQTALDDIAKLKGSNG